MNEYVTQTSRSDFRANEAAEAARVLVERTGTNLFLTGKAGTGKTTFLKKLQESSRKRIVVVAPTGIAAINAGGVTIHSFFQLDFNYSPESFTKRRFDRFSKAKLNLIKSFDLLVIDEISMVRADLLDRIDEVLRRHRNPRLPFGGVQLLMIGDLHQLPPVVTESEVESIRNRYASPYFFESEALKRAGFRTIELTKVYRQNDEHFIGLLNAIRTNRAGQRELAELNTCVGKRFPKERKTVRLVTHNRQARDINETELALLGGSPVTFTAAVEGKFPESSYPGEEALVLKKGAQVMFIKNDLLKHEWYNGLLGTVTELSESLIKVRTTDDRDITVRQEEWVNNSYKLDEENGEVKEIREGAFRQYPLRLAWAITIHKSQGLTFDTAVIDATNSFAHGQTYVALSRCRTLEGLALERPLTPASIITDVVVEHFMASQSQQEISPVELDSLEKGYTVTLLHELFDFTEIDTSLTDLSRVVAQLPLQYTGLAEQIGVASSRFRQDFIDVSRKFETWFPHFAARTPGFEAEERIHAGAGYFARKLSEVREIISKVPTDVGNKEVMKRLDTVLSDLRTRIFIKHGLLTNFETAPFTADAFLRLKSALRVKAEGGLAKPKSRKAAGVQSVDENENLHPDLETLLKKWRSAKAASLELPAFRILSNKAVRSVANGAPETLDKLKSLKHIGDYIAAQYGEDLIKTVKQWKSTKL